MRKGQATIEFLMTYGWAIFLTVIVVGILAASGIFSPTYLIAEECAFGTNIQCDFALYNEGGSGQIAIEVFNGFPYKIDVKEVQLESRDGTITFTGFGSGEILSGDSRLFTATSAELEENNIQRFIGNITYVSCASEIGPGCSDNEHILSGRVVGRIIPSE